MISLSHRLRHRLSRRRPQRHCRNGRQPASTTAGPGADVRSEPRRLVMAIAGLMANAARVMAWLSRRSTGSGAAYAIPGIPAASLGAIPASSTCRSRNQWHAVASSWPLVPLRRALKKQNLTIGAGGARGRWRSSAPDRAIPVDRHPLSIPAFLAGSRGAFRSTSGVIDLRPSRQDPHLPRNRRALRRSRGQRPHHRFLADGRHVLRKALRRQRSKHDGPPSYQHRAARLAGVGLFR